MQRSNPIVPRVALIAAAVLAFQGVAAAEMSQARQIKAMVDFQCHGVKTLKQAEANYANNARSYTDQHPLMECLSKKIVELKAAGK